MTGIRAGGRRWVAAVLAMALALVSALVSAPGAAGTPADRLAVFDIAVTSGAAPGYVPDRVCAGCHGDVAESFSRVGMGRSFARATAANAIEDFADARYFHAPSGRHYAMELRDGRYHFRRWREAPDGTSVDVFETAVDWIVGSGHRARVYLYSGGSGTLFQLPLAWYSQTRQWAMAPGFEFADQPGLQRQVQRRCMACHNAYPDVPAGSDADEMPDVFPAELPEGIGCQRCHGPGAEHAALALEREVLGESATAAELRATIVEPGRLPRDRAIGICYGCHMQPSISVPSAQRLGRGDFAFRPGEDLDDHIVQVDIVDRLRRRDQRFDINHHAYRLEQSACFVETGGGLDCLTCHDPHRKVPPQERAQHYRAACMTCHAEDRAGVPVMASGESHPGIEAAADCTTCHMPQRRTQDVIEVWMTDHRIQRDPGAVDLLAPIAKEQAEVTEVLLMDPPADLGAGEGLIYKTIAILQHTGNAADYAADALAEALVRGDVPHAAPWVRLARAYVRQGRHENARLAARGALAREPAHPEAHKTMGLALYGLGEHDGAVRATERALSLAPEMAGYRYNLALIHGALGDSAAALREARAAVDDQWNLWPAWRMIGDLEAEAGNPEAAAAALRRALEIHPGAPGAREALVAVLERLGRGAEASVHRAMLEAR